MSTYYVPYLYCFPQSSQVHVMSWEINWHWFFFFVYSLLFFKYIFALFFSTLCVHVVSFLIMLQIRELRFRDVWQAVNHTGSNKSKSQEGRTVKKGQSGRGGEVCDGSWDQGHECGHLLPWVWGAWPAAGPARLTVTRPAQQCRAGGAGQELWALPEKHGMETSKPRNQSTRRTRPCSWTVISLIISTRRLRTGSAARTGFQPLG